MAAKLLTEYGQSLDTQPMKNQTTDAFNYHVVTYARVYFDHNELASDLMGDPADFEEKTFAELGVADIAALHDYVRADKTLNAYEVFKVYHAQIDGHGLTSEKIPLGGVVYFSGVRRADEMEIIEPSEMHKPREEQKLTPLVTKNPELAGRVFALPGLAYTLLEDGDSVFDRASGECLWGAPSRDLDKQIHAQYSP